jgi:uncharacterized membrane protein HdeD (DUF308 family)
MGVRFEAGPRVRSHAVKLSGAVKRLVFLLGVVVTILGVMVLNDPAAVGPYNCGTALAPKRFVQGENAGLCKEQIRWRRRLGGAVFVVGVVAVALPGPRCLLADD